MLRSWAGDVAQVVAQSPEIITPAPQKKKKEKKNNKTY
jgi:hypothetical protein